MTIAYTYKVTRTVPESGLMEIEYSAVGYETLLVGAAIPKEGATLEDAVRAYAPIHQWEYSKLTPIDVPVGAEGYVGSPPAITLEQKKAAKIDTINAFREVVLSSGVLYGANQFDSDPISVARLTAVATALNAGGTLPSGFVWRSSANVDVPFSASDVISLLGAMIAEANRIYQVSWVKKAEVEASTTEAELDAVTWSEAGVTGGV